jgi:hypothetical protein
MKTMKNLIVSDPIKNKLQVRHSVSVRDVEQCFENKCGMYLQDIREDHQTDPPTLWFVAPNNSGRMLKIMLVFREGSVYLKSAYDATPELQALYEKYGK